MAHPLGRYDLRGHAYDVTSQALADVLVSWGATFVDPDRLWSRTLVPLDDEGQPTIDDSDMPEGALTVVLSKPIEKPKPAPKRRRRAAA